MDINNETLIRVALVLNFLHDGELLALYEAVKEGKDFSRLDFFPKIKDLSEERVGLGIVFCDEVKASILLLAEDRLDSLREKPVVSEELQARIECLIRQEEKHDLLVLDMLLLIGSDPTTTKAYEHMRELFTEEQETAMKPEVQELFLALVDRFLSEEEESEDCLQDPA